MRHGPRSREPQPPPQSTQRAAMGRTRELERSGED